MLVSLKLVGSHKLNLVGLLALLADHGVNYSEKRTRVG